jgi:hypothetical protein
LQRCHDLRFTGQFQAYGRAVQQIMRAPASEGSRLAMNTLQFPSVRHDAIAAQPH